MYKLKNKVETLMTVELYKYNFIVDSVEGGRNMRLMAQNAQHLLDHSD